MSVAITNTKNTMGVRTLSGTRNRRFLSSHPRLSGYVTLHGPAHGLRGLGDDAPIDSSNYFRSGLPLDPDELQPGDPYSLGALPTGPTGYSLTTYMPDAIGIGMTDAPVAPTSPGGGGVVSATQPIIGVTAQPAPPAPTTAQPGSAASAGGTFPIWVGIAVLVAAAFILPPLIKKL